MITNSEDIEVKHVIDLNDSRGGYWQATYTRNRGVWETGSTPEIAIQRLQMLHGSLKDILPESQVEA